jgi:hypothetical protein
MKKESTYGDFAKSFLFENIAGKKRILYKLRKLTKK